MTLPPVGFDLDMTLIDSRASVLGSFATVAREMATPIDLEVVASRLGLKLEAELAFWFAAADIRAAAACFRADYVIRARVSTPVLPGAHAALAAVAAAGARSLIITAKHWSTTEPALTASGLRADEVLAFRHGPEKATALREQGAGVYVGDTPADMAAAASAGAVAVGVSTGAFTAADLDAAGADAVLSSLEEFPGWYGDHLVAGPGTGAR